MSGFSRGRGKSPRGRYRPENPTQTPQPPRGGHRGPPTQFQPQPPMGAWSQRPQIAPQAVPAMPRPQSSQMSRAPQPQTVYPARAPQPQGAWAARSQAPQQYEPPQREIRRDYEEPASAVSQAAGDVTSSAPQAIDEARPGAGGDASVQYSGRGGIRGQRVIVNDYNVVTKPATCQTKQGTTGRTIMVSANYFDLLSKPNWCIYQYRVDFAPEEELTSVRKSLFRTAVKDFLFGYLFDGTVLYAPNRLSQEFLELFVINAATNNSKTRITLKLVGDVVQGDHHYLQLFNIIVRKCMTHLNLQLVGRNYFDPGEKSSMEQMEIWPGYITSIRQHEKKILMCCEITHKVMQFQTALDVWSECLNVRNRNPLEEYKKRIIGCVVLTDYNNKTYRISDVDEQQTPADGFLKKDGTKITYAQYFAERYRRKVTNMRQPILVHKSKGREIRAGMSEFIYLVPELCRMTGLTERQRQNFTLMKNLANYTRVTPNERIRKTLQFSERIRNNANAMEEIKQWDFKLARNIIEFPARVLPAEKVIFNNHAYLSSGGKVDWTNDLKTHKMFIDKPLNNWVIMFTKYDDNNTRAFVNTLKKVSSDMAWKIGNPTYCLVNGDDGASYVQKIKAYIQERPNTQLIVCILSNNRSDRYSAIKKECILKLEIPSQVVLSKNITPKQKAGGSSSPPGGSLSVVSKVAVQLNAKLGGSPWTVLIPLKHLMVIGYDVCHDPNDKSKSIGAIVASMDTHLSRYCSNTTKHTSGQELSSNIAINCIAFVQRYKVLHNILPERIVLFRDGVGDGQLHYVLEHEIVRLKTDLEQFYKENNQVLKLAFIVVSKRINTRIFNNEKNPDAGTVVDSCITLPQRYDFFLVSQCVHQGTVTPTSYNIIYDTAGLSADKLQLLSYKLTHMYYNWSGTVRVPAPCQYAHKLAFLTAQSLRDVYRGVKMDNLLYFL
ncbi:PREDICTED: protein aubergine isoform X2 [Nicrophorus vespilloides]|nr:PREDICTED: protein aubergine isoform X2 [Nicrophorus vespilloides]XP_017770155.1 PREDICTED: protein aubergine isoform X2 [Nicrophorus vespilloides]